MGKITLGNLDISKISVGTKDVSKIYLGNIEIYTEGTVMPVKGDIIALNLDGTERQYRVLKIQNNIAEILLIDDITDSNGSKYTSTTSGEFSDGGNYPPYDNSELETFFSNIYASFSDTAKAAIVEKDIIQDAWLWSTITSGDYIVEYTNGSAQSKSTRYLQFKGTRNIGKRKIYPLSIQSMIDYFELQPGDTMTAESQSILLYNTTTVKNTKTSFMLTASAYRWNVAVVGDYYSSFTNESPNNVHAQYKYCCQIDLSKISFNIVTE